MLNKLRTFYCLIKKTFSDVKLNMIEEKCVNTQTGSRFKESNIETMMLCSLIEGLA